MKKTGKEAINLKQRKFCELYATDAELFGCGTNTYIEVYEPKKIGNWYNSSAASASRLLKSVNVLLYINELLEEKGLNDKFVDKQLLFLITQHADFKAKLGGIKEYNQLKQRIRERIDVTSGGKTLPAPIIDLTIKKNGILHSNSNSQNKEVEKKD